MDIDLKSSRPIRPPRGIALPKEAAPAWMWGAFGQGRPFGCVDLGGKRHIFTAHRRCTLDSSNTAGAAFLSKLALNRLLFKYPNLI